MLLKPTATLLLLYFAHKHKSNYKVNDKTLLHVLNYKATCNVLHLESYTLFYYVCYRENGKRKVSSKSHTDKKDTPVITSSLLSSALHLSDQTMSGSNPVCLESGKTNNKRKLPTVSYLSKLAACMHKSFDKHHSNKPCTLSLSSSLFFYLQHIQILFSQAYHLLLCPLVILLSLYFLSFSFISCNAATI